MSVSATLNSMSSDGTKYFGCFRRGKSLAVAIAATEGKIPKEP